MLLHQEQPHRPGLEGYFYILSSNKAVAWENIKIKPLSILMPVNRYLIFSKTCNEKVKCQVTIFSVHGTDSVIARSLTFNRWNTLDLVWQSLGYVISPDMLGTAKVLLKIPVCVRLILCSARIGLWAYAYIKNAGLICITIGFIRITAQIIGFYTGTAQSILACNKMSLDTVYLWAGCRLDFSGWLGMCYDCEMMS